MVDVGNFGGGGERVSLKDATTITNTQSHYGFSSILNERGVKHAG
jgi:hypothetical protein